MLKSIKSRVAAAEKSLAECDCSGKLVIHVSGSPHVGQATCARCGRDLHTVVVVDPYFSWSRP